MKILLLFCIASYFFLASYAIDSENVISGDQPQNQQQQQLGSSSETISQQSSSSHGEDQQMSQIPDQIKRKVSACTTLLEFFIELPDNIQFFTQIINETKDNEIQMKKLQYSHQIVMKNCMVKINDSEITEIMNLRQDQIGFQPQKYTNLIFINKDFYRSVLDTEFSAEQLKDLPKFQETLNKYFQKSKLAIQDQMGSNNPFEEHGQQQFKQGIFWIDMTTLSSNTKIIYTSVILGIISLILFLLIRKITMSPVDLTKQRRKKLEEKRQKSGKSN